MRMCRLVVPGGMFFNFSAGDVLLQWLDISQRKSTCKLACALTEPARQASNVLMNHFMTDSRKVYELTLSPALLLARRATL